MVAQRNPQRAKTGSQMMSFWTVDPYPVEIVEGFSVMFGLESLQALVEVQICFARNQLIGWAMFAISLSRGSIVVLVPDDELDRNRPLNFHVGNIALGWRGSNEANVNGPVAPPLWRT